MKQDYEVFVEKFKRKKTTDDCYTPKNIYEAIKNYVIEKYKIKEKDIVRPFYPHLDYETFNYKENAVVIDNPPFSISSKIYQFYLERNIKFFLFAPTLTIFSSGRLDVTYIINDIAITYENGAKVNTSFVTNLDDALIKTDIELYKRVLECEKENNKRRTRELPKYKYPSNLVTVSKIGKLCKRGIEVEVRKEEAYFVRGLESQKKYKKNIFGAGFLVSDEKARELEQLEKIEIEKKTKEMIAWELSEREREVIKCLSNQT